MALTPDDFRRVRRAFEAACERAPDEREAALVEALRDEPALLGEARAMLAHDASDPDFLEPPSESAVEAAGARALDRSQLAAGARLGEFELIRPLGGGGMGEVWLAQQSSPRREVAVKALRASLATPRARRRFEEESELLARLSHPGIAEVVASGVLQTDDGLPPRPWFAMELVAGARPLTGAAAPLALEARLALFLEVCDAIHHGHLRGVVHRDLKPDNVLVDGDGRVRVIDFGIGRVLDEGADDLELTGQGELLGTIAYMSPEQVRGERDLVDIRTDVHALGVLLFELLCGRSPWRTDHGSWTALAKEVVEVDPPPPSRSGTCVASGTRGIELDWIVARAMAKEVERRYASAGALADDVRRFLGHEPLVAGPPSLAYRTRKFARRHRAWVVGGAVAATLLVAGTIGTTWGWLRALDREQLLAVARAEAQDEADRATALNRYLDGMLRAPDPFEGLAPTQGETTVAQMLDRAAASLGAAFPDRPTLEAETRLLIGTTYGGQGRHVEALEQFERALELARGVPDRRDLLVTARHSVAASLGHNGRMEESLDRLQALHTELTEDPPAEDQVSLAERARIEHDLAWALENLGHSEAALALRDSPLREHLGPRPAAIGHLNLARTLHRLGRDAEAESTYHEAIALLSEAFGGRSPVVGLAQGNLGSFHYRAGRLEQAEQALGTAVDVLEETLDPGHPLIGTYLSSYSGVLAGCGRNDEAETLNVRALEILMDAHGPAHEDTISALNNLAYLHSDIGRWAEAATEYHDLAEHIGELRGPDDWQALLSLAYAGECTVMAGEPTRGATLLDEALARADAALGRGDVTDAILRAGTRAFAAPELAAQRAAWSTTEAAFRGDDER